MDVKFIERFNQAIESTGLNKSEFARRINASPSLVTDIVKGRTKPSDKTMLLIELRFGISQRWLMTGVGPQRVPEQKRDWTDEEIAAYERFSSRVKTDEVLGAQNHAAGGCIAVNIYNMVEAGNGAEPDWHDPVAQRVIPVELLKPQIRTVLVRGRSMEPTFRDGAIIGVDQNDKQVIDGEAYAVLLPYAGAAVKRLYPLPDGVLLRSDNKEFPEVTLKKSDIPDHFILGRVRWVIQEL